MTTELVSYAVTPGVGAVFFTPDQLRLVSEAAGPGGRVELNTFMQLIVHTPEVAVAAQPVHFPVRIGFSGCPNNCGEALLRDIGARTALAP